MQIKFGRKLKGMRMGEELDEKGSFVKGWGKLGGAEETVMDRSYNGG